MQYLELIKWPNAGVFALNDVPSLTLGELRIFELISNFECLEVRTNGRFIARYKHIALKENCAFVYDFSGKQCKLLLGEFKLHRIDAQDKLKEISSNNAV